MVVVVVATVDAVAVDVVYKSRCLNLFFFEYLVSFYIITFYISPFSQSLFGIISIQYPSGSSIK